jgi:xylulokinase
LELLRAQGVSVTQVRASGGGARSPFWQQILADVFEAEIVGTNVNEGAAYGAALLAGVGTGVYPDVPAAAAATIRTTDRIEPGPAARAYADYYPIYRALYPALAPQFQAVSAATARQMEGS